VWGVGCRVWVVGCRGWGADLFPEPLLLEPIKLLLILTINLMVKPPAAPGGQKGGLLDEGRELGEVERHGDREGQSFAGPAFA